MKNNIKKYDLWLVDLNPIKGSEQAGIRPCLVIQNNDFFEYQNTTIILPITSSNGKNGNFKILIDNHKEYGLSFKSSILSFQIKAVDKTRFIKKVGEINDKELRLKIRNSLILSLDVNDEFLD